MIKPLKKIEIKVIFLGLLPFIFSAFAGIDLITPLFLVCLYLYAQARRLFIKNCNLPNLALSFLIIFVSSYFICGNRMPLYYIPFSVIPMLLMLLFGSLEISLLIALGAGISVALAMALAKGGQTMTLWSIGNQTTAFRPAAAVSRYPLQLLLLFLVSAILGAILVSGARKRVTIMRAGIITGIAQLLVLILTEPFKKAFSISSLWFLLNGVVSSIIVLGILPIFEYLFSTVTNISLLELADFHQPLLELLIEKAPGTYYHSLIVGNLSETAARSIGANALLSRVGAYYHDIGKLQKPEYFSENQDRETNKHDTLTPTMSKLIIMNHVKEGIELAKKYKLNPLLIDFIEQHHGNSLVYYFYRRALESHQENQDIKEEGFRYPGPKPNSKETAIVLLADSVEAAARALKEPSPAKIEELVHKVINNKFIDGQLDECDLTLKDLEKISAVFIRLLCGIYHSRTNYPDNRINQP